MRLIQILILLALTAIIPLLAQTQKSKPAAGHLIHRSPPPPDAITHVVVLGERFRAGKFKKWLYGSDYRQLWTTPIEIPVLNLDEVGGGLTPLRTGGFGQSISLHFTGQDGHRYTVRSIDKDPTKRIWDALIQMDLGVKAIFSIRCCTLDVRCWTFNCPTGRYVQKFRCLQNN